MRPVNGLYLLRLFSTPAAPPKANAAAGENATADQDAPPSLSSSSPSPADRLRIILRLRFHGVRAGGISGSARVVSPGRAADSSPRAVLTNDGVWSTDPEGAVSVAFSLHVDRIESHLVGGASNDLTNVTVQFPGTMAGRVFVGAVTVYQAGGSLVSKAPENGIRAVMKELSSPRCANCHDPVEYGRSPCFSPCRNVDYCSNACQEAHRPHYNRLTRVLPRYVGTHGAKCTAAFSGVEFAVYWAAVMPTGGGPSGAATGFNVLVDSTNPLGVAYEMRLDVLIDARVGTSVSFVNPDDKVELPSDSDIISQNYNVFEAIIYSAVQRGCGALAAACLNHLFRWCDFCEFVERLYIHYYDLCIGSGWEGQRVISSLGEYATLVRPMYEGSTVLVEAALKSMTAADFWFRLENAKGILVTLYNLNGSVTFTPTAQTLRTSIVPEQQRQTLLLLARVFLIMASRTGKDFAPKMLKRAEECYRDALDEDKCRNNFRRMGYSSTQLSALYLVFPDPEDRAKAQNAREQGLHYLAQSLRSGTDATASALQSLVTLTHDDFARMMNPSAAPSATPPAYRPEPVVNLAPAAA